MEEISRWLKGQGISVAAAAAVVEVEVVEEKKEERGQKSTGLKKALDA